MENENIVKETALSVARETAKDVYSDAVQPTAKNVGGFFGTLSGFFNHVVMYPLKKLNIKYEQKAIAFEKEMEHKYNSIPEKERVEPQLHIVGPTNENPDLIDYKVLAVKRELFGNINVTDPFFATFCEAYTGFEDWFIRKSNEEAYVCRTDTGAILGFLYLSSIKLACGLSALLLILLEKATT